MRKPMRASEYHSERKTRLRRRSRPGAGYYTTKRVLDLTLVVLSVPVWLPILALAALAIKVESPRGPLFFAQKRTGAGGRRFRLFKLRTMVPEAEQIKTELAHLNQLPWPDFKIANDPRITRVGSLLRKTSIDELPQLLNVLRGDMSLVGPRPTSFHTDTYSAWHTRRLEAIPGLTGLWQVERRGTSDFDERLRLDIEYLETRTIAGDLKLLLRTSTVVFKGEGR